MKVRFCNYKLFTWLLIFVLDLEAQAENKDDTNEEEDTKIQDKDSTSNTPNTSDCRVYVKNIKLGTTADQIKKYFQSCGEVKSVKIIDRDTNNFAFVNFKDKAAVAEAIKLHNKKFNNATISVYANDPQRKFKKRNEKLTIKLINKQDFKDLDSIKLEDIFSKCGEIIDLVVLCKKNTLAFITFKTEQAVQKVFELNGTTVQDIELEIAAYDTQKPKTTIYVLNIHPGKIKQIKSFNEGLIIQSLLSHFCFVSSCYRRRFENHFLSSWRNF